MHPYGHVGVGLKGANFEMLLEIAAATNGGRRLVIAMGDFNITANELETSGVLRSLGLTLIRADNTDITCTAGKGSCIDYALVTSNYTEAIVSLKADKRVPWGPHFGLRIKFKTMIRHMKVPDVVRPRTIEKALEHLKKKGW